MKNKKGFTLAELLGVIVILLLLVLIVTPLVLNYSKKASDSVYDVQINTIKASAKEWATDDSNIKLIPTEENECIEVSLEKLKEAGYLDYNIKNPKTNEKFDDNLTVIIKKEGKTLTYTFNEDGTQVCDTVVTTDYPKWVYISSNPHLTNGQSEVTVNVESNKQISEYNLTADDIQIKVGSTINDNANIVISCNNTSTKLSCEVKISNLEGNGKLALVIDKNTMKDMDLNPSRITSLITDTTVDTKGPEITYTGRTNTNASTYYATKDDEVVIKFKAEDEQNITSNLTANDIKVYLDGVEINPTKELTKTGSGKKIDYALKITNVEGNGKVSIKVPSGKIEDSIGNINGEKTITPGITFDNIKPTISFTPNEETRHLQYLISVIDVIDNETGVDDSTVKYIVSTNSNATPETSIGNGGQITIKNVSGQYYIVGYACDYAGNCNTGTSGIYNMNNTGPGIEIAPTGNTGYAKTANIKIIVTQNGTTLDEGSFVYTISTDATATPDKTFINNQNLNIPAFRGIYYVIATACDMDSNCSTAVSGKFYFDNTVPEIKYTPNGTSNAYKKSENVAISVTDNIELDWSKYVISTSKTATPNVAISNGLENKNITGLTGIYYIVAKGCDKLGNCAQTNSDKYYFDNTGPTITFGTNGNGTAKKSQSSTVTLADAHVGSLKNLKYTWSTSNSANASGGTAFTNGGNISKSDGNGTFYLCVYGEDGLGNGTNKCSGAFKFDNTAPTIAFGTNGNTSYKKSHSSTITVTNDSYGATLNTGSYKYVWNSSTSATPTIAFASGNTVTKSDGTGDFYLIAYACDSLGNCSKKNTSQVFRFDNTNPTVTATVSGTAVTFKFKDVHSGLAGYNVSTGTGTPSTWNAISGVNTEKSVAYTATSAGTFYVHVKDAAGNTTYTSFAISSTAFCNATPGQSWTYSYTGKEETFSVPCDGVYEIEIAGGLGGESHYVAHTTVNGHETEAHYETSNCLENNTPGKYQRGGTIVSGTYDLSKSSTVKYKVGGEGGTSCRDGEGGSCNSWPQFIGPGAAGWNGGNAGASGGKAGSGGHTDVLINGTQVLQAQGDKGRTSGPACFTIPDSIVPGGGSNIATGYKSRGEIKEAANYGQGYVKFTFIAKTGSGAATGSSCPAVGTQYNFDYTGSSVRWSAQCKGTYKLEVWGSQGGNVDGSHIGGKGGYTVGTVSLNPGDSLYVTVGSKVDYNGANCFSEDNVSGGYNGGGAGNLHGGVCTTGGGGATHISTNGGLLSDGTVRSGIRVAAGGGGGASQWSAEGGYGGGATGGGDYPGTQTAGGNNYSGSGAGGAGYGGSQTTDGYVGVGGGAGWYGGSGGGSGGSGYFANVSGGSTTANQRTGNGYARITVMSIG